MSSSALFARPLRQSAAVVLTGAALMAATGPSAWAEDLPRAVETKREMVVTANPLATAAGEKILKVGGTAADAMVAVQTVLGLVEPQSSGIGGGAFIVYHDAASGETITVDAREKAPASATETRFQNPDGTSMNFLQAWQSGLSVGVPGVPRMMEMVHDQYGRLPWPRLFVPAITLAQKGFELTERTSSQIANLLGLNAFTPNEPFLRDPAARDYFLNPDGTPKPAGTLIRNKPYAETLKRLRRDGADAFYIGPIAEDIVAAVQGDLNIPGDMTLDDLANYDVILREPVCLNYRSHDVCGMGPPSSGGIAVGQILGILENFDLSGLEPVSVDAAHLFTQAGRLAFADRGLYVADSDFVPVPVAGLLDETYLASRAALITNVDMGPASPGIPPGLFAPAAADANAKTSGTSHVSIIDQFGNALSMTTTIESSFGNGVLVRGFLLNNELTDFSFQSESGGQPIANRVQGNKRPRSSMSPSIVFDGLGDVEIVTGSPGGSRIIAYTAQSIMNMIDFGRDPQEAINSPHYQNRNGGANTELEMPIPGVTGPGDATSLAPGLQARGHSVTLNAQTSGLSIIQVTEDGFIGGADRRRDGAVGGR